MSNPGGRPRVDESGEKLEYISIGLTTANVRYFNAVQAAQRLASFAAAVRAVASIAEQQKILLPTGTDADAAPEQP